MRHLIDCFLFASPTERVILGFLLAAGAVCWMLVFKRVEINRVGPFEFNPPLVVDVKQRPVVRILVGLAGIFLIIGTPYILLVTCSVEFLYRFDGALEGWQYLPSGDGQQVATGVDLFERESPWESDALRCYFDFGLAEPSELVGDEEPRATFSVDNMYYDDWTRYQVLAVDARSLVGEPLEMNISVTIEHCWYELGVWRNLTGRWETYRFDLRQSKYKTCEDSEEYTEPPPVPFEDVRRLNLIIGTNAPQVDWPEVRGSVLIDNVRLETDSEP